MKGWRPSAIQGSTPDRALYGSGRILAGHRIDRPVFSAGSSVPELTARGCSWTPRFPFRALLARGRQVRQMTFYESAIVKWRQPFTCSRSPEDPETKTKRNDRGANKQRPGCARPSLRPDAAQKIGKRPKNCQIRPESAASHWKVTICGRQMLGFPSDFSWISFRKGLDFLPEKLGFPSGDLEILHRWHRPRAWGSARPRLRRTT
jgi:hypothetical protein